MARVVDALEVHRGDGDYGRFSDYPWSEWTDGQAREAVQGEDFSVATATFRVYLYQWKDLINRGEVPQPLTGEIPSQEVIDAGKVPQWAVRTRIVAPGVVRFFFEPDDEPPLATSP